MNWIQWIRSILELSKTNIIINGSPTGCVLFQQGLLQGDPSPPCFFFVFLFWSQISLAPCARTPFPLELFLGFH